MKWWVNKFGRVTGPYSDEQIQSGIRQNQFTRLNKISNDQQTWMRLDQTKFWQPVSPAPESAAAANPFETGAAPGKLRRPSATPTPEATPFRRPAPAPEPEESMPPPRQTPPLSSRSDLNQKPSGGDGGGKNRKWLWIGGGIAACFAPALVAVVLVIGVLAYLGSQAEDDGVETAGGASGEGCGSGNGGVSPRFEQVKRCVALVHAYSHVGSGFLVKMDGKKYVMTNDHVARSAGPLEMVLVDGTKLKLGAFSLASDRDLARFEVIGYDGDCLEFSKRIPNDGEKVWVYGNSSGDDVITCLPGRVTGVGNRVIKIDAEFVGGNSGGPILDSEGKVLAVSTYVQPGNSDWKAKGTQFEQIRRFGVRAVGVNWVSIDREKYENDCVKLSDVGSYIVRFVPYFVLDNDGMTEELYAKLSLRLEYKDAERKMFSKGSEGDGFHEMLKDLSRSCARQGNSWSKWKELQRDRSALIDELNKAIDKNELTLENGKKALAKFDVDRKLDAMWENVKSKHRDFNAKRKEALLMARDVLTRNSWNSLMRHGYRDYPDEDNVDYYLSTIQDFLDQNAQKLKDLNKQLRTLEGKEDEE